MITKDKHFQRPHKDLLWPHSSIHPEIQLTFLCQVERLNTPIPPQHNQRHDRLIPSSAASNPTSRIAKTVRAAGELDIKSALAGAPTLLAGICLMPPTQSPLKKKKSPWIRKSQRCGKKNHHPNRPPSLTLRTSQSSCDALRFPTIAAGSGSLYKVYDPRGRDSETLDTDEIAWMS